MAYEHGAAGPVKMLGPSYWAGMWGSVGSRRHICSEVHVKLGHAGVHHPAIDPTERAVFRMMCHSRPGHNI